MTDQEYQARMLKAAVDAPVVGEGAFDPDHADNFNARQVLGWAKDAVLSQLVDECRLGPCTTDWFRVHRALEAWRTVANAQAHLERAMYGPTFGRL